ncbi:hypothetical protein SMD44_07967 [Streptomyces alboflavus]|uniref:Uncharacterized protein n=1 Tax=Streptomyces alboflavus TaxID=67267 RepID=A0A1Z1WPZ5_9ACTN|nr:hypothetical protein SMD44_07967 [Streptomyces alboflavus]
MAAARRNERSRASSRTGTTTPRRARSPLVRPARRRRARCTRCTLCTSCGATLIDTVTATPSSYSAPGRTRSARLGLARVFAAPTQHSMQASRSPSMAAESTASRETGPPSWMPAYQSGVGMCGRENRKWSWE